MWLIRKREAASGLVFEYWNLAGYLQEGRISENHISRNRSWSFHFNVILIRRVINNSGFFYYILNHFWAVSNCYTWHTSIIALILLIFDLKFEILRPSWRNRFLLLFLHLLHYANTVLDVKKQFWWLECFQSDSSSKKKQTWNCLLPTNRNDKLKIYSSIRNV